MRLTAYTVWYTRRVAATKRLPASFFRNDAGGIPVREWLRSPDKADRVFF
jgi:hypothetical protein